MFSVKDLAAMKIGLASPEKIRSWSHGEVTKSETINYRSQKPEMKGLFCEKIFGPSKDYECNCGRYKKIRYQGVVCEKCGVEVISKQVRRERMGHIELASPCTHIWYLKGIPSRIGLVLGVSPKNLEEVVYFSAHICLNKGTSEKLYKHQFLDDKCAKEAFTKVINEEILPTLEEGSVDYNKAKDLVERMSNINDVFMFADTAAFVSKYTGAEFGQGAAAIKRLLSEINIDEEFEKELNQLNSTSEQQKQKSIKRLEVLEAFRNSGNKPEWMVLDVLPVIPPDLRPMLALDGGRFAASDLNELYRRVINRNNTLKKLIEVNAPSAVLGNQKRMLQEAVDALIDNGRRTKAVQGVGGRPLKSLTSGLKGKQGRFRQNLLGKRVDYSGRSVIAVGPDLKMYQCGLPREMAVQLLRPFIASILIKEGHASAHKQADKIIDNYEPIVFDIVEDIIGEHPVLLNRAPTLHRLGIQAFQPKLVDGRAIRLHPLVCTGFNADFDGDQMAVHVPLSKAAQEEALNLMLASNNILGPKDGKPIVAPSQDMVLGNYYLTLQETKENYLARAEKLEQQKDFSEAEQLRLYAASEGKVFRSVEEVQTAYATKQIHLHSRIAILWSALKKSFGNEYEDRPYLLTTVGKILFNIIFPADFPYLEDSSKDNLVERDGSYVYEKYRVGFGTNIREEIASRPLVLPFKKGVLSTIINEVFKRYGTGLTSVILDKIKDQGFKYSTVAGVTVAISDMSIVEGKFDIVAKGEEQVTKLEKKFARGLLTEQEKYKLVTDIWTNAKRDVTALLKTQLETDKRNPLWFMLDSGARGSYDNFVQLEGIRGLMNKPNGEVIELPIKSSFREGMTVSEFFIATHGARKGGSDTALKTADSGYLTRRLVDVSQDVIIREVDCGNTHGFAVSEIVKDGKVVVSLLDRIKGRFAAHDIVHPETGEVLCAGNTEITGPIARSIEAAGIKTVEIRNLFGCQTTDGVCVHCYGRNLATDKLVEVGEAVGIMAAQSIGEPGTQLTMRTFHSGGVAESDITQGLPRVEEIVQVHVPKRKATIAEIKGEVTDIREKLETDGRSYHVVITNHDGTTTEYDTEMNTVLTIDVGTPVNKGTVIAEPKEKGKKLTAKTSGVVTSVTSDKEHAYIIAVSNDIENVNHITSYGATVKVKVGDKVVNGDTLTDGAIYPKDLLKFTDLETVQRHLVDEIRVPYLAQNISINDKHMEVIVRQMLRKLVVTDGGDTKLLPGTRISVPEFTRINEEVLLNGLRPAVATPLILSITKAALETDSFLSAASFQETTRVLTDAAIKSKVDTLHGLKENVITGKLIPAGRGLAPEEVIRQNAEFDVNEKIKEIKERYIGIHDHK